MQDGELLRARGPDGRTYVTVDSLAAIARRQHRQQQPLRRGAASDELAAVLSSLERLVGVVHDERAAVREPVLDRDQARIESTELRGQFAAERACVRRLEELLLTLASERTDSSAPSVVAREILGKRSETSMPTPAPARMRQSPASPRR
jgi:hypothetical protein